MGKSKYKSECSVEDGSPSTTRDDLKAQEETIKELSKKTSMATNW